MIWLPEALDDLERLHDFLADLSPQAAQRAAGAILAGAEHVAAHPEIGRPMGDGRREWFIAFGGGFYVLRYRLSRSGRPVVLRVWHGREDR